MQSHPKRGGLPNTFPSRYISLNPVRTQTFRKQCPAGKTPWPKEITEYESTIKASRVLKRKRTNSGCGKNYAKTKKWFSATITSIAGSSNLSWPPNLSLYIWRTCSSGEESPSVTPSAAITVRTEGTSADSGQSNMAAAF
jgi:hypothetical protein